MSSLSMENVAQAPNILTSLTAAIDNIVIEERFDLVKQNKFPQLPDFEWTIIPEGWAIYETFKSWQEGMPAYAANFSLWISLALRKYQFLQNAVVILV